MDTNRFFTMLSRMFFRRATNWGVRKGIDMAAGKGKPAAQMSTQERDMARKGRDAVKLARKSARITRRLGR
ncbi:hypothetical protein SAMN05421774_107157 [Gemmobacter megaterium]|uniref:Uncharacterized protein n=1 Tax=Gemmobacter megaterium TaxID=1086013 RepID=A0A1N7Q6U5_9RHOB|nr:hypothetical protein [Gemmobacter megaterium]GGE23577.1 hypothetical protein GCM10011345_31860 [Gemmobacter megaterium]SIT18541.1 hypothetical protein SAMN05421774_107157 [Gemmobacter megaterium]